MKVKPIKVMTVVGTRPEIIRLSRVINRLNKSESFEHILVHTGQNYDYTLNEIFFQDLNLPEPNFFLDAAGENASQTIGQILIKIDAILAKTKPEVFLVLGDTNSCLSAIPAKKRKIPIFHMEAGNRCFDQRVPEEINRKLVDHLADINLTYSRISRQYLLQEGLPPDQIIDIGSPMFEILDHFKEDIQKSNILKNLKLENEKYFLVSAHREENIDNTSNFKNLIGTLNALADIYNMPVIVSTHPRTKKRIEISKSQSHSQIRWLDPQGFFDYNKLQKNAFVVLSDSGTISEESSILNFKALNIRESHERPEAMEEAAVMMVGLKKDRILQALEVVKFQNKVSRDFPIVQDYSKPNVSLKVERIILSYIDYINSKVWRKES